LKHAVARIGLAFLVSGCASPTPVLRSHLPPDLAATAVELDSTPFYPQSVHQCGPAALATTLTAAGASVTPDALTAQVYLPAREGSLQAELVAATRRHDRLPFVLSPHVDALLAELRAGYPVLVLQNLGTASFPVWHYAVVIGYLPGSDQVILRSGTRRRETVRADRFLTTWQRAGSWGLVTLRPGEIPATAQPDSYLRVVAELESIGRTEAAGLAYAAATRRWPDNAIAWIGLGNTEFRRGDLQKAGRSYREAIRAEPGYPAGYNNLAEVAAELGCFDAALATLDIALQLPGAAAQRLRGSLLATRREVLTRRPKGYRGDGPTCSRTTEPHAGGGRMQPGA
jgi:tetratricopeptide (TPR) repeat protein